MTSAGVAVGVVGTRNASGFRSDGAEGTRTPDLCHAKAALFQLSYSPEMRLDGVPMVSASGAAWRWAVIFRVP